MSVSASIPRLKDKLSQIDVTKQLLLGESKEGPILLLFLRHFGCTFCREALADLSRVNNRLEEEGLRIAIVHMSSVEEGERFAARYDLKGAHFISDPTKRLYREFDLKRGTPVQLFGPKVWFRGFSAGVLEGHGIGRLMGDGLQMPGSFVLDGGRVVWEFRHKSAADRPNYSQCTESVCDISINERVAV